MGGSSGIRDPPTSTKRCPQHVESNKPGLRIKLPVKVRRIVSASDVEEVPGSIPLSPKPPITEEIHHRLEDLYIVTKLAIKLYSYLWNGTRWWFNFMRLLLFTLLLLPGFFQMILFYFFSPRLLRSVPYGAQPRNRLDIYLPRKKWRANGQRCPVCIYVTGGAWTIGYKAWGALFGRRLSQRGILVFCLDYRNFPQGSALDMLRDVNTGISWCMKNAELYGGNGEVFLVGQSAGGHLTSLALLAQANQLVQGQPVLGAGPHWDITSLRGFAVISGAFNLVTLADHMHKRGLYHGLLNAIMAGPDGQPLIKELSPTHAINTMSRTAAGKLPPVLLLHGSGDRSVPIENAIEFAEGLKAKGVSMRLKVFEGKTHTQPIVEDPMRGGRDELMDEVLSFMLGKEDCYNVQFPMLPAFFIDAASAVCPF